ncbi:MAG: hypothetical protein AAFZ05_10515 [Pseudomonadota bacterium]
MATSDFARFRDCCANTWSAPLASVIRKLEDLFDRRAVGGLAIALFLVTLGVGLTSNVATVEAQACKSGCLRAYNQCRIATNGSSSCDRRFQNCIRRCLRRG